MARAQPNACVMRATPRILVCDDIDVSRCLLRRLLTREGYDVTLAEDGAGAMDAVEHGAPNLILLDLRLPDIDGEIVLSRLREARDAVSLPIIMVSAEHEGDVVAACLSLGANDYVTKPIHWPTLRARMHTHLGLQATREALSTHALETLGVDRNSTWSQHV